MDEEGFTEFMKKMCAQNSRALNENLSLLLVMLEK